MSLRLIFKYSLLFLLILLWVYAAGSKLMEFNLFKAQMRRQVLPEFLKESLVYILPSIELITAVFLLFERTARLGLYLSGVLLFLFTAYVGLAFFRFLDSVPCSCGGILASMGWGVHLIFNVIFLLLTVLGIYQFTEKGGPPAYKSKI
jgi:hypothetical protein